MSCEKVIKPILPDDSAGIPTSDVNLYDGSPLPGITLTPTADLNEVLLELAEKANTNVSPSPYRTGGGTRSVELIGNSSNNADAVKAIILGGDNNNIPNTAGEENIIIGGSDNEINTTGTNNVIIQGNGNIIDNGSFITVVNGENNTIETNLNTPSNILVIDGKNLKLDRNNSVVYGNPLNQSGTGVWNTIHSDMYLGGTTTNATPTELTPNINIKNNSLLFFDIHISGMNNSNRHFITANYKGILRHNGTTLELLEVLPIYFYKHSSFVGSIAISSTSSGIQRLLINVTGDTGTTITWNASIKLLETILTT